MVAAVTDALAGLMEALAPVGGVLLCVSRDHGAAAACDRGVKGRFQDVKDAINNAFTPEQQAAISNFFETLGGLILAAPLPC